MSAKVAVLDYGCGNVRSAVRALERVGARTELTARRDVVLEADGLVVPGVGAFGACLTALQAVHGASSSADDWRAAGRSSGSASACRCSSSASTEPGPRPPGPGRMARSRWSGWRRPWSRTWGGARCSPPGDPLARAASRKSASISSHSYAVRRWELETPAESPIAHRWSPGPRDGDRFVAAVENGPLSATQFHPEKSGDAGAACSRTGSWAR